MSAKGGHERKVRSLWSHLARALRLVIEWLAILLDHGKPIRVSLLVLSIAAIAAISVDQAAELFLIAIWIDPDTTRYVSLLLGAALTGLAIWYTARHAYRLVYPRWPALQDPRAAWLRDWLPRLLGTAVPVLVLLGYRIALQAIPHATCGPVELCRQRVWRTGGLWLEALLLVVFFMGRRPFVNAWRSSVGKAPLARGASHEPRVHRMHQLGRVPITVFLSVIALNVFATALVVWQPGLLDGVGPIAILMIAGSFMCISGGFLCMLADRRGLPLLSLILLMAVVLHAFHMNDNHHVRQYAAMKTYQRPTTAPVETRPRFDDYANAWLDSRCARTRACPVIVVSAEGGGIRSAAWTAFVLSRLNTLVDGGHAQTPGQSSFAHYLFAGSGVSGGSLGLAIYVAQLRQSSTNDASMATDSQRFLSHDFLAPMLANMFFVDFTQRWLPFAWFDDRARALTRAWEQAARIQGIDAFDQPFSRLYEHADGRVDATLPALFLNSTTVDQGWRFVQDPFRPFDVPPWTSAYDGSAWLDPRVPLSEVVLNSARFTYVSPAGTLDVSPHPGSAVPVPVTLQLVDGGYFENSGTTTLQEIMSRLRAIAKQRGQPLRFIVLHISNDPTLLDFVDAHDPTHPVPLYSPICPNQANIAADLPSGEVTAPIKALLDTREARGEYARAQLLAMLSIDKTDPSNSDVLWHIRLCPGEYPLPLGWTISTPVFDEMNRQWEKNYPLPIMAQWLNAQLEHATQ